MIYFRPGLKNWNTTKQNIEAAGFEVTYGTEFTSADIVVNWGGTYKIQGGRVWNPPEAVKLCSDKTAMIQKLEGMCPISTTEYSAKIAVPFVMKKNHTHKGFGKRKVNRHTNRLLHISSDYDLFQEYIDIETEWRVLVFWNGDRYTILRIYEKIDTGEPSPRPNFHPNWEFQMRPLSEVQEQVRQSSIEAARRLGMHLVGLDVVKEKGADSRVLIIEANSAPGLGESTARKLYKKLSAIQGV